MDEAFQKCADKDPILANAISMSAQQQKRINARLRATLEHIFALEGYTGISDIGQKGKDSQSGMAEEALE
ncbi:hypothetical protein JB92DRAFT_3186397, partial [Gautieria morchelliformis]